MDVRTPYDERGGRRGLTCQVRCVCRHASGVVVYPPLEELLRRLRVMLALVALVKVLRWGECAVRERVILLRIDTATAGGGRRKSRCAVQSCSAVRSLIGTKADALQCKVICIITHLDLVDMLGHDEVAVVVLAGTVRKKELHLRFACHEQKFSEKHDASCALHVGGTIRTGLCTVGRAGRTELGRRSTVTAQQEANARQRTISSFRIAVAQLSGVSPACIDQDQTQPAQQSAKTR